MTYTDPGDQPERVPDSEDENQLGIFATRALNNPRTREDSYTDSEWAEIQQDCDPPRARTTDPETSHEAAESMVEGAKAQRAVVLHILRFGIRGKYNADEIDTNAQKADKNWPRTTAGRRLPELRSAGLVERLDETRATRSGRQASLWRALL